MERRTYCSNHTTSSRVWRPWYRAHERTSSGIPLDDEAQTGFRYRGQWVSALWWPTARDWRSDRAPCHRSNSRPPQGARWHRTTRARTANPDPCELSRKAIVSQVPITHWRQFHLRSNECPQRAAHQTSEHSPGEVTRQAHARSGAVYPLFKPRADCLNTSIKPSTRCSFSLCAALMSLLNLALRYPR